MSATPVLAPNMTACPECDGPVNLNRAPMRGQIAVCPSCAVELEVLSVQPLAVGLAPKVEEDWGE